MQKGNQIKAARREAYSFVLQFLDDDGNPQDISAYTIIFALKKKDLVIDITSAHLIYRVFDLEDFEDPEDGIMAIKLTDRDMDIEPDRYSYAVLIRDGDNEPTLVLTGELICVGNAANDPGDFS